MRCVHNTAIWVSLYSCRLPCVFFFPIILSKKDLNKSRVRGIICFHFNSSSCVKSPNKVKLWAFCIIQMNRKQWRIKWWSVSKHMQNLWNSFAKKERDKERLFKTVWPFFSDSLCKQEGIFVIALVIIILMVNIIKQTIPVYGEGGWKTWLRPCARVHKSLPILATKFPSETTANKMKQ